MYQIFRGKTNKILFFIFTICYHFEHVLNFLEEKTNFFFLYSPLVIISNSFK